MIDAFETGVEWTTVAAALSGDPQAIHAAFESSRANPAIGGELVPPPGRDSPADGRVPDKPSIERVPAVSDRASDEAHGAWDLLAALGSIGPRPEMMAHEANGTGPRVRSGAWDAAAWDDSQAGLVAVPAGGSDPVSGSDTADREWRDDEGPGSIARGVTIGDIARFVGGLLPLPDVCDSDIASSGRNPSDAASVPLDGVLAAARPGADDVLPLHGNEPGFAALLGGAEPVQTTGRRGLPADGDSAPGRGTGLAGFGAAAAVISSFALPWLGGGMGPPALMPADVEHADVPGVSPRDVSQLVGLTEPLAAMTRRGGAHAPLAEQSGAQRQIGLERWGAISPPADGGQAAAEEPDLAMNAADPASRTPFVVHTEVHLDGRVIAHAVSERIVAEMNGPLAGTGGFDPRRSYTPVEG